MTGIEGWKDQERIPDQIGKDLLVRPMDAVEMTQRSNPVTMTAHIPGIYDWLLPCFGILPYFHRKKRMKISGQFLLLCFMAVLLWGCKKDSSPTLPKLTLKTGAGYTYTNGTIGKAATFKVGFVAEKTKNNLLAYIIDYSLDGGPVINSGNGPVTAAGTANFESDFNLITRNQAGTEKWIFRISDSEGNLTSKEFTLTVQ